MRLGFFGAAGEVTGSCTLVETGDVRFLVDCGMFQGGPEARSKNQQALNFGFGETGRRCDTDGLFFACAEILGGNAQYTVGVKIKGNLDLRYAAWRRWNIG